MEQGTLLIVVAVIITNCAILFLVIQSATKAQSRYQALAATLYILAKIAKQQGVDEKEVDDLIEWAKR